MDIKTLLQINQHRIQANRLAYIDHVQNEALLDKLAEEEAERQSRLSELIRERAAREMAKAEKNAVEQNSPEKANKAGAVVDDTPLLQPLSFVPDSTYVNDVLHDIKAAQDINFRFYNTPQNNNQDKYYPKSWLDMPGRLTYNPETLKPMWGQTVREQIERKDTIANSPALNNTANEFDYYDQLTRQYILTNQHVENGTPEEESDDLTLASVVGNTARVLTRNPLAGWLPAAAAIDELTGSHIGIANWIDNTLSYWNIGKNKGEISAYQGDIVMNDELRGYIANIAKWQDLTRDLEDAKNSLKTIDPNNEAGRAAVNDYIKLLETQLPEAERNVDIALSHVNDKKVVSDLGKFLYEASGAMAKSSPYYHYTSISEANRDFLKIDKAVESITNRSISPEIQKLVDQYRESVRSGDPDKIRKNSKLLRGEYDKLFSILDAEDEESRKGMRKNIQELENWKKWHTPSEDFVRKAEEASQEMSFLDPNTYLYGLPGLFGSSATFNGLQWANTALSLTAGAATSHGAPEAALPLLVAGQALGIESAHRENAAEVVEHVNQAFQGQLRNSGKLEEFLDAAKKATGKDVTFEEAVQLMALGTFTPSEEIKKMYVNSTFGSRNLFKHDMLAVTGENLLDATINFVPFGKIAGASWLRPISKGINKMKRLSAFKAAHPDLYAKTVTKGGKFAEGSYDFVTNNFSESWYNFGASINPVVGLGTATIGAVTKPVRNSLSKHVSMRAVDMLLKNFGTVADWAYAAPKKLLDAKVIGRSGKDWVSRILATSYGESIEEGKQYYHGKEFAAGKYAGESDSMWDLLLGDIEGGSKSALQFAGSFLGLTSDKEWVSNMRGGFLAGGGHTAIMAGYGNFSNAAKEINANHLVINNILSTKLQERADIMKGIQYAKRASFGDRRAMMMAFDNVAQLQEQITQRGKEIGDPEMEGIAPELIEDQRKLYNKIFNIANSSHVQNAARARGIKPGSDRYATLVSLVNFAQQEAGYAMDGMMSKLQDIQKTISQELWGVDNIETASDDEVLDIAQRLGISYKRSSSPVLTNEAIAENKKNRRQALLNRQALVNYIAHLDALLSYRDQLELKDNKTEADHRKLRSIKQQIEDLRNTVRDQEEVIGDDGKVSIKYIDNEWSRIDSAPELQKYVYDIDLHEVISDQYRDVANFMIDYDHAAAMEYNLIGSRYGNDVRIGDSQIQDILDKINTRLQRQYESTEDLTDNRDIKITDTGLSHSELNTKAAKKANAIIDRYLKSVNDDKQFNLEIQDDFQHALDALYGDHGSTIVKPEESTSESETVVLTSEGSATATTTTEAPKEEPATTPEETPAALPAEMTEENFVEFGDLADYVDQFSLHHIPEDKTDKVSEQLKEDTRLLVNDFNIWLKEVNDEQRRIGGTKVSEKKRRDLILKYEELLSRADIINERIDSELAIAASQEDVPLNAPVHSITEEDIIDAIIAPMDKWINDIKATVEYSLNKLQEFLYAAKTNPQSVQSATESIKQIISNLDEIFNLVEELGLDVVTAGAQVWYFGTQLVKGARELALEAINAIGQALPQPIVSRPVISEQYVPDLNSWTLFTTTAYNVSNKRGLRDQDAAIVNSHAVDDPSIKLSDVIGDPRFVEEADFELIMKYNNQPFVRITYKGHTFTDVFILTAAGQNASVGKYFWNTVRLAFSRKGNNQKIVPVRVYRSFGKERRRDSEGNLLPEKTLTQVGLITEDNMYQLEFTASQNEFGVTEEHQNSDGTSVTTVYTPSESGKGHNARYEYSNSSFDDKPGSGLPIFLYDRKFSERGDRRTDVPINLLLTKITSGDAKLIVEILQGVHCADKNAYGAGILGQQYVQDDGKGNLVEYGITNGQVLRMLMKYGAYDHEKHHLHIEFKPEDNRFIRLVGFIEGDGKFDPNKPEEIPSREYNIHEPADVERFMKDVVGIVYRRFDSTVASSRVGENFDTRSVFYALNKKRQDSPVLQKMLQNNGQILFGNSSIVFDAKDFQNENDPNTNGVSGIVWYARHGFITTRFAGFDNTVLVFDENAGINLVDKDNNVIASAKVEERILSENEKIQNNAQVETEPEPIVDNSPLAEEEEPLISQSDLIEKRRNTVILDEDEFRKTETTLPSAEERINMSEAKQHLLDILGSKYYLFRSLNDNTTEEQMKQMFKNGPVALGTCSNALIELSKYAKRGTEYHEAFHFIVEYLMSDRQRMKVYEAYAKAKHIKLKDDSGNIIVSNMKLVTEGLADEYMMYNIDRPTIKLSLNMKEFFKSLIAWGRFFKNIGSARLLWTYYRANSGYYKNVKVSENNAKRAAQVLDSYKQDKFYFTIDQHKFQHILNNRHYRDLCDTMMYIIIQSQENIDVAGRNIQYLKVKDAKEIREYKLFKKYSANEPALAEMLDNWDVVSKDIMALISLIANPNKSSHDEEDNVEDMQGDPESVSRAGIDEHTRSSNEFSQFSRATDMVKYFFATIPNCVYAYTQEGKRIQKAVLNGAGLPTFVKASTMYNTVLNQVYNCRSLSELIERLETIGEENAQFNIVANRIKTLKKSADEGNVRDASLLAQLCVNLHASKGQYIIVKANRDKNGNFDIIIQPADGTKAPGNIRRQWSRQFAGGASSFITQDANGNYVMKGSFKPQIFSTLSQFLQDFLRAVSDVGIQSIGDKSKKLFTVPVLVDGKVVERVLDVTNTLDLQLAKSKLISVLNKLGITFTVDMLNYMLNTKYGSSDYKALNKLFTDNSQTNLNAFAMFIQGFNANGKLNVQNTANGWVINQRPINQVFGKSGFVGMLADWAYNYKKSTDQLSILANKENRQYLISENNYLTDAIDDMNASIDGDKQKIDDLKSFVYNWYQDPGQPICASIILKNFSSSSPQKLSFVTDSGFRTNNKGDIGEDYAEITPAQDEVSKIEMLLEGKIIFPTMSDKKTWGYVDGIHLPGLNFKSPLAQQLNSIQINPNGSYVFNQNDAVLSQLIEYAELEHQAIIRTLRDVRGYTDPNTGVRTAPMREDQKVDNYHKATVRVKGKSYKIIQGARFSTLYAIYDNKGKKISFNRVCDSNGNFVSEEDNLAMAEEWFFGVPSETEGLYWIHDENGQKVEVNKERLRKIQKTVIQRSLQALLRKQINKALNLGLIERVEHKGPYIYQFKNKLLNVSKVNAIKQAITVEGLSDQQKESMAIAILLNDVSCKSIMSLQETERIFSGHPAFYKWSYNSKGELSDRSTDQHKRFGGLVSTGQNNAFVFSNMPTKYTAAEIDDIEVESEHMADITRLMYENELRSTYLKKLLKDANIGMEMSDTQIAKDLATKADNASIEEIEKDLDALTLSVVKRKSTLKINSFRKSQEERLSGINVADGATYITDDMCENMLKQVGAYSPEVQIAFKVLRGEPVAGRVYTTKDVRELASAYELVTTTVIGTQKYTAYGFRKLNGLLVPYYNKTAIFPMFKSLCTGKTADLFDKMKKQKVDMVMLKSAVKVGSQGSQKIDWDNFDSFTFNTYEQEYRYLRKQFNTDPKEKELMAMGTQMTKIIMSSMIPGRDYVITNPDGSKTTVDAKQLRDDIMLSMSKLSDIGYNELRDRLFKDGRLDVVEFSKFLTEELASRGASREMLDAVSIVDENTPNLDPSRKEMLKATGKKELKVPLTAMSGMNWIQSIINAKVNKSVIDINTPGAAFIQRSVFGIEGTTMMSDDNLPPAIYEGRKLLFRNENGSMDCVLSIDFFKHIIPQGLSFKDARQWLIDNKIISGRLKDGTWSDADASIVGYRIPTQAQSSIHALRVVDVIETVSDTIILPTEFTKITGADFDIDKLFLSTFFYNKDENGNVSKVFEKDSKEAISNELVAMQISLLKDSKSVDNNETRAMHTGDGPIDGDTKLLTDIVDELMGGLIVELDPYDPYSLWRNTSVRDQFITGKFGIGPFALNNNNHILTMLYDVSFAKKKGSILSILGRTSLHDSEDMYGESIMSWLSGLINAHVDIAKDPYIPELNVNSYTYNLVNLLVRTGFGKKTFYFMKQPIMVELAKTVNNAASGYGSDATRSKYRRLKDAELNFILDYANDYFDTEIKTVDDLINQIKDHFKKKGVSYVSLYESIFNPESNILRDIAKNENDIYSNSTYNIDTKYGHINLDMQEIQLLVYLAKTDFEPYSQAISSLVKYCKIDTKKQGKSLSEQRDFMRGYNKLFNENSGLRRLFDTQSLKMLQTLSYVDTKTINATNLFSEILSDQLLDATIPFDLQVQSIIRRLHIEDDNVTEKLCKKVSNSLLISIRSDYFNQYAAKFGINIRSLVNGDNTIYDKLNDLKNKILSDPKYEYLRGLDGSILNYLIDVLTSDFTHKQNKQYEKDLITSAAVEDTYPDAKFISTLTFMDDDSIDQDEMMLAWEELLQDSEHPEIQQFARELIVYSFITTGGNGGANNLFKYIPTSWIVNPDNTGYTNSYAYYMALILENYRYNRMELGDRIDDVILNNWTDYQFIPTVDISTADKFYTGSMSIDVDEYGYEIAPEVDVPVLLRIDPSVTSNKFIKVNRQHDPLSQRSVAIYKRVRVGYKRVGNSFKEQSIYVLVEPKGQNFYDRYKIYEYGRSDASVEESSTLLLKILKGKFADIISVLGANTNNIEDVLDKLISFVQSKKNKEGAIKILEEYNTPKELLETVIEATINEELYQEIELGVLDLGFAEEWSKKEGWSIEYFKDSVLPRLNEAWLIEYELAEDLTVDTDKKAQMLYSYGSQKRDDVESETTLEAIKKGERTATTRYESDGKMEFWKSLQIGDIVEFYDDDGNSVKVRITKPAENLYTKFMLGNTQQEFNEGERTYAMLSPEDSLKLQNATVIWAHPGSGKTYLHNKGRNDIIDFDSEYKSRLNEKFGLPKDATAKELRLAVPREREQEYHDLVMELFEEAIRDAKKSGKKLLVSDMMLLREREDDIDVFINMSNSKFIERSRMRGDVDDSNTMSWKNNINNTLNNIKDQSKIINTDAFLELILPKQQTNQQQNVPSSYEGIITPVSSEQPNILTTAGGVLIPFVKGVSIQLPSSIGATKFTIERVYEDPVEGTKFYGKLYDRYGNEISDVSEVITYFNTFDDIKVYSPEGEDITNKKYNSENKPFDPLNVERIVENNLTSNKQLEPQLPDKDGVILGRLGVDKSQLIALLGNTMYTANVQDVAEKELVQNAFDATKIAAAEGKISKGKIDVYLDSDDRTLTVKDNGSGMSSDVVQKAFFTIGGSYKGDNVDNRLKSGGLGLAKMAFLFSADYVELTTVKDGKKTYVKATPLQIQNDDFKILVSDTDEPNGTKVTVRIPETYVDQEGNQRDIWFSTWGRGFFGNHMIGNVLVTKYVDGKEQWSEDFNKIPDGYTLIGTATTDFGDIEIYKDFTEKSSTVEVLISGLYQFNTYNSNDGDHYRTIVNILPTVSTKSEVYPINNLREGFRSTVDPEKRDLMFFLSKLDNLYERKRLKNSFGKSFNMDSKKLLNIEKTLETSTKEIIDSILKDINEKYKAFDKKYKESDAEKVFGIILNTIRKEREDSEKNRRSSFNSSSIKLEDQNLYVDTSNMDREKPVFYNNTNFKPSEETVELLTKIGEKLIQLRDSFLELNTDSDAYDSIANDMRTLYWGIAIDKTYNGINVSPSMFNFIGINPIGMVSAIRKHSDITNNFEYVLEELIFHNILHEVNHNSKKTHNESFTIQFQYTYAEFANIGKGLHQWRQELRDIIHEYLKPLIEDVEKYEHSENVGDSLEGRKQQGTEDGKESSSENNGGTANGSRNKEVLSDVIKGFVVNNIQKYDIHGNLYGWSIESIKNHLLTYLSPDNYGYTEKHKRAHVKNVNKLYGTNFGVYKKDGILYLKDNTKPKSQLTLSDNPNLPKQLTIFDQLRDLGEELMRKCNQ